MKTIRNISPIIVSEVANTNIAKQCLECLKQKKQKGIYGSASQEEVRELKEEGIDAQIIPWIEDKSN